MSDHDHIARLVIRFADAVNRVDATAFAALWAPRASRQIDPPTDLMLDGSGAELADVFVAGRRSRWTSFVQLVHGTVTEVDGDRARARSYLTETAVPREGVRAYANQGAYIDALRRIDGAWRFESRHYR